MPQDTNLNLHEQWNALQALPDGKQRFSAAIGNLAAYSGTIRPEVLALREGYCKIQMQDRPEVRNHLNSVHAIAVMNLAELTSGLAMLYGAPDDARGIIKGLSIEYPKKARGTLTAECHCELPPTNERKDYEFAVSVRDAEGDVVAQARAHWLVGPK